MPAAVASWAPSAPAMPYSAPAAAYRDIAPRLSGRLPPSRPFHPAAYRAPAVPPPAQPLDPRAHGFPRAAVPIRPWIPGVSTPEGLLLATATVLAASEAFGPAGEQVARALQGAVTVLFASVVAGIPASALWLGDHLASRR